VHFTPDVSAVADDKIYFVWRFQMTIRLARRNHSTPRHDLAAADVMTTNPKSIGRDATIRETAEFFRNHGIHTAPVIDEAGRPIGVVSRTDLLDYWGRRRDRLAAIANGETTVDSPAAGPDGAVIDLNVTEIMTPVVFSVSLDTPLEKVIEKVVALEVRCLFVTDDHGILVGVISVFDLLRSAVQSAGHKERGWRTP
jgi:CBS-domain-containing membrane protein